MVTNAPLMNELLHERGVMPTRIQRKRTKGWRMPPGAVYVGRPSRWGNRFRIGDPDLPWCNQTIRLTENGIEPGPLNDDGVVYHFRLEAVGHLLREPEWLAPLRGHDLACWCPLDQPCHADVLLELTNRPSRPPETDPSRIEWLVPPESEHRQ